MRMAGRRRNHHAYPFSILDYSTAAKLSVSVNVAWNHLVERFTNTYAPFDVDTLSVEG